MRPPASRAAPEVTEAADAAGPGSAEDSSLHDATEDREDSDGGQGDEDAHRSGDEAGTGYSEHDKIGADSFPASDPPAY